MTTTRDAQSVIQALDDACNAHDMQAVMDLFAESAVVTHTPPPDGVGVYRGKEEIQRWFEPQLAGFHVRTWGHQTNGDTVRWSGELTSDLLNQMGQTEPIVAQNIATVRDGKIVSFIVNNPSLMAVERG